ncbi:MAG: hypothetical protein ABEL76_06835 [Bradymonadaceae bacterium]
MTGSEGRYSGRRGGRIRVWPVLIAAWSLGMAGCSESDLTMGTYAPDSDGRSTSDVRSRGDGLSDTTDVRRADVAPPDYELDDCLKLNGSAGASDCDVTVDPSKSVFVAPDGRDNNPGTKTAPLRTLEAGLKKAAEATDKSTVLAQVGQYEKSVQLKEGVDLIGGYAADWSRAENQQTRIVAEGPAVKAGGISKTTRLVDVEVRVAGEPSQWKDVVTVYFKNSNGIELFDVRIIGADGGEGSEGLDGEDGATGPAGGAGDDGGVSDDNRICDLLQDSQGDSKGGSGGSSPCEGSDGGDGGNGGEGSNTGKRGEAGSKGGGRGGAPGQRTSDGSDGKDGDDGEPGDPGEGGEADGRFDGLTWKGNKGERGGAGESGKGGGGGGGGGGGPPTPVDQCVPRVPQVGTICTLAAEGPCTSPCGSQFCCRVGCAHFGGGGGGGGAGGCGGKPGEGGRPGGATAALLLERSNVRIVGSYIEAGDGGDGGDGGEGGDGGDGGDGGSGGSGAGSSGAGPSGAGGAGGDGGKGGAGGAGGGGAGGPSFGIYSTDPLDPKPVKTTIQKGRGGEGGGSPAGSSDARGERGLAEKIHVE